jgi:DNA-binding NarL/FixJ family response regulator
MGDLPGSASPNGASLVRLHAGVDRKLVGGLVRVVLADDMPLLHLAVRSILAAMRGYALAAAASNVTEAEQLILRVEPEMLICDVELGGESGIALCQWTRLVSPRTRAVLLTGRDEPLLVQSALSAGAFGYLLKDSPPDTIIASLQQIAGGARVLDERLGQGRHGFGDARAAAESGLSRREREVLDELLAGLDNRAIAGRLCIAEDTVKSHMKAIFRKLGARDRAHAVALALGTALTPDANDPLGFAHRVGVPRPREGQSEQRLRHRLASQWPESPAATPERLAARSGNRP